MRTSFHDLWGSGRGPLRRAAPPTRLVAGAAAFAACMVSTGATLAGSLWAGAIALGWVLLCRPPWSVVRAALALGLALLLPYFLLLPLLPDASAEAAGGSAPGLLGALAVPWTILLRGLSGTLVCVATATTLSATDLREALLRLPVPGLVSAILLQIVHQSANLLDETRQVAAAMAVRGASSGGLATAWRVLFYLPQAWLPRVVDRAERVGAAMELRGYCEEPPLEGRAPLHRADAGALGAAVVALSGAVAVRVLGMGP